ncbi:hypothetical protein [Pseudonocardia spinosispora]|uniref:hypothetical protein n=1 Tax=Pseudonocardia spinosispora TaxID=103441 RepID=UPI0004253687|nr:hypothetical protein [Pseudonocardia spinosispora]
MTDHTDTRALRLRYGAIGLVLGVIWVAHASEPAWEHAVRALVLVAVAVPLILRARKKRAAAGAPPGILEEMSLPRMVAAKIALIAVALLADWTLSYWTSASSMIVALGLVLGLAAAGPALHTFLSDPKFTPHDARSSAHRR